MRSWYRRSAVILLGSAVAFVACDKVPETPTNTAPSAEVQTYRVTEEPDITEERAEEIWSSPEVQHMLDLQHQFVERVDAALARGVALDDIRAAMHLATSPRADDSQIVALLYESREEADRYVAALKAARAAIPEAFPEVAAARDELDPAGCTVQGKSVDGFFNNYDKVRESRLNPLDERNAPAPVCGSRKNQLKLLACATLCSFTSGGLGTVACGWGCWCTFCSKDSVLATYICAD